MKNAVLWKRILNEGIFQCHPFETDSLVNAIISSTIICVGRPPEDEWRQIDLKEYRRCCVPFTRLWIEQKSSNFVDPGTGEVIGDVVFGYFVSAAQRHNGGHDLAGTEIIGMPYGSGVNCTFELSLDAHGDYVEGSVRNVVSPTRAVQRFGEEHTFDNVRGAIASLLDVLMLLGCKNVSLEPRDNDPKQVRRAIKRHGNRSHGYRYHVLVVRPAGSRSSVKGEEVGVMPLHLCRGHFSEYGPEFGKGLLFGKYAGRFYIPPHMKGKKENGEVAKDYEVRV